MSLSNGTAQVGQTVCGRSDPGTTGIRASPRTPVTLTFGGNPPYRLTATPQRGNGFVCASHQQNLTTNTFVWNPEVTTNVTAIVTQSGDLSTYPGHGLNPVFQDGEEVQWIAHEWALQPNGQYRYFKSQFYVVTSDNRQSGGLKVANIGIGGWFIGALLLSGVLAVGW